jgi:hypothetical protein
VDDIKVTDVTRHVAADVFLPGLVQSTTSAAVEALLGRLPVVDEFTYRYDEEAPACGWQEGRLHWVPIGRKRGNAGQISLVKRTISPVAERLINGMEAIIELRRQRELLATPDATPPGSPREAMLRYCQLPPLDQLPRAKAEDRERARELARSLLLCVQYDKPQQEFAVLVKDRGIGQPPSRMHKTLLSLGSSDKGDKFYLIGVFGQGGSSTYKSSKYSWIISRRAPDLLGGEADGVGWTLVKHIIPRGRRDPFYAYLAAHPDGRVPALPASAARAVGLEHGSWFAHIAYDFGGVGRRAATIRSLYQALNHVLFNPVLPFDTEIAGTKATIYGNGYRLSNLDSERKDLDKTFEHQPIA